MKRDHPRVGGEKVRAGMFILNGQFERSAQEREKRKGLVC